jgi:hypothetical protein
MKPKTATVIWSLAYALCTVAVLLLIRGPVERVVADAYSSHRFPAFGYIEDSPTFSSVTINGTAATTGATPTSGVARAHISFYFYGTVGTYSGCSVQAQTAYDGINFVNLGSAQSVTVSSGAVNVWDIQAQAASSSGVTVTTPSSSAATSFGQLTQYKISCTTYGTDTYATVKVIYQ